MIKIKAPEEYVSEENALDNSGKYISKIGNYALIIGSRTSLKVSKERLNKSFEKEKIKYVIEEYNGYCTFESIDKYSILVKKLGVNLIVGIGGGKIIDLAKAVGEKSNLKVVAIPTIAATCAAWSALSVVYDKNGVHKGYFLLNNSPKMILIDTGVIFRAPTRYLNAGIGDTIAKWYESTAHNSKENSITLKIGIATSKLAFDILKQYITLVLSKNGNYKELNQKRKEVIDSIIMLAGLVGSVNNGQHVAAIAHALHDSFTHIEDTKGTLHGEKIVFGLIVQLILEKKSGKEIKEFINIVNKLDLPVTLGQLGIRENVDKKVNSLVEKIKITKEEAEDFNFEVDKKKLKEAIIEADKYGNKVLKEKYK